MSSVSISLLNALRLKITWIGIEWDCFTCEIAFTVGNQEFFSVFGVCTGYAMMHNVSFKMLTFLWSDFIPVAVGL